MREPCFVAVDRGGLLTRDDHRLLADWAADCAEHVLFHFEDNAADLRPRQAISMARSWSRGEAPFNVTRQAALAAHAAARAMQDKAAIAAARSAGHAAATAHMADHCLAAADYALKAIQAAGAPSEAERAWQLGRIPEALRESVESALVRPTRT